VRPPPVRLWVEPFAGSAAVALALCGGKIRPPVCYMGAKTRYARDILGTLGVQPGRGAEEVLLVDAGPWAEAWSTLLDAQLRAEVCRHLRAWSGEDPVRLWYRLAAVAPAADPAERVAGWLWLQGRSASACPVWFDGEKGWRMGDKPRCGGQKEAIQRSFHRSSKHAGWRPAEQRSLRDEGIHERAGGLYPRRDERELRPKGRDVGANKACGGIIRPGTVAERIEALAPALRGWRVVHGDVGRVAWPDLAGAVAYLDPPYVGCTGYAAACPRADVLQLARELEARGAVVIVSEAVPLDLPGWHAVEITRGRKPEVLTLSRPPVRVPVRRLRGEQLSWLEVA
jgi:hypothetical protein